jgi:adenine-specific DNA-methyltransferase
MKDRASRVTVDKGQVVKVTKDKKGVIKREVLTKAWTDWIDYWAVDFDFENRKEIIRVTESAGPERTCGSVAISSRTNGSPSARGKTGRLS